MIKKRGILFFAAAFGILLFSACVKHTEVAYDDKAETFSSEQNDIENAAILRWAVPGSMQMPSEETMDEVQKLLEREGISCQLEFVQIEGFDQTYQENLEAEEMKNGSFDLACSGIWFTNYNAAAFVSSGYYEELDTYLESDIGKELYASIPADYWKTTSIDGVHYTVPNICSDYETRTFIAIRTDAAQLSDFDGEFESLYTLYENSGEQGKIYIQNSAELVAGINGYQLLEGLLYSQDNGSSVSIADAVRLERCIGQLKEWMEAGKLEICDDTQEEQNITNCYAYIGQGEVTEEIKDNYTIFRGSDSLVPNAVGLTTGIVAESSQQELARKILHLLYTNFEFSNLLVYGPENTYILEDGMVSDADDYVYWTSVCLGIYDYVYPVVGEQVKDRKEARLETMPASTAFIMADQVLNLSMLTEEQQADREQMMEWLLSWQSREAQ